ncbi:MAG: hypothetical protein K2M17_03600, partial [Bacilli bacterium]|nr:hypothetical protein [Bacilli bacterium]
IIEFTSDVTYEYVIVINGEVLNEDFLIRLRASHSQAKFILYMWDSLENFSDSKKILKCFDKVFSFDHEDCEKYSLNFLPLFYYEKCGNAEYLKTDKQYDYVFIGTIKKGKIEHIRLIFDQLDKHGYTSYKYLYLQSRLVYLYYKFKYKEFKHVKMSMFKYKRLSNDECNNITCKANIVVDVPMKSQNGLTIRVFETLSRGQKLLTTNANIVNYDFYNENQIYVYDGNKMDFNSAFFTGKKYIYNEKIEKYHIEHWLDTLMETGE